MHTRRFSSLCILVAILIVGTTVPVMAQPAASQFVFSPTLPHFVQELRSVGPNGIPLAAPDGVRKWRGPMKADHYTIDMNQFTDTLHPDLPPTTLWGYNPRNAVGVVGAPASKHLGGIFVVQKDKPVQVTFVNNLPPAHILPVDTTLMTADLAQNRSVVHLHGGFDPWISDGIPTAWWDPQGGIGPSFINNSVLRPGQAVPANEAEFYYPNQSSARMQWYHDHVLGITRLNVGAGLASAYFIRDDYEAKVLVKQLGLPKFFENGGRELPIIIQDKTFEPVDNPNFPGAAKTAGSIWIPYIYDPTIWELAPGGLPLPVPSVVPETFGDTTLVNGTAYPKATVEPRRYRLRILNACGARFMNLALYEDDGTGKPDFAKPGPPWLVIGAEGGFLAKPVIVPSAPLIVTVDPATGDRSVDPANPGGSLITSPAERWDVIVDFNGQAGKKFIMWNDAPAPFPGGMARFDYPDAAGHGDTQSLMRFEVGQDSPAIPADPKLRITPALPLAGDRFSGIDKPLAGPNPAAAEGTMSWLTATTNPLPVPTRAGIVERWVTLNEGFDAFGRLEQLQGTNVITSIDPATGVPSFSLPFNATPTETPKAGTTEVWHLINLSADTHPIHTHLVNGQIISRQTFDVAAFTSPVGAAVGQARFPVLTGTPRGPLAVELGYKETFKAHPGEVTTFIAKFVLPKTPFTVPPSPRTGGLEYVWHCHILDHEEHDMMRPLIVLP